MSKSAKSMAKKVRKKVKKSYSTGRAYISAHFNNTFIHITDDAGNGVAWSSAGHQGFKGSRKSTPFAAQVAADHVATIVRDMGMKLVNVFVKGPGPGRESAVRALGSKLTVVAISDVTPIPFNGCRGKKSRRV